MKVKVSHGYQVAMISFIAAAFSLSASAADLKLGYIDMQKAIQETAAGKKAKKDLEEDYNKKKKEIEKKEADLKKMNEDLEKKSLVLSDEVRGKKQQEMQAEMGKYRELVGKSQMDIQKKEQELTKPIIEGLRKIINEMAEKDGYTMIFESSQSNVLFAKKEIDLTEKLVQEFEKKKK